MTTVDLAQNASKCLEAWTKGDFATARSLLSDHVTFDGPMGHTEGADNYVSGVAKMADMVTGVDLKKLVVEGDDVCIMYDLLSRSTGAMPTVGWYHFSGDKIDSVRAYFDPRPLTEQRPKDNSANNSTGTLGIPLFAAGLQVCHEGD